MSSRESVTKNKAGSVSVELWIDIGKDSDLSSWKKTLLIEKA